MTDLDALKARMEQAASAEGISDVGREYVQATLEYGVAEVREEYTKLAKGNRAAFDRFAGRVTVLLAALTVGLLGLGVESVNLQIEHSNESSRAANLALENRNIIARQKAAREHSIIVSCEETNARHDIAAGFIVALIAKEPPKTAAERERQRKVLPLFEEAIAPQYLAGKGTLKQRRAAGCAARLAKFSKP